MARCSVKFKGRPRIRKNLQLGSEHCIFLSFRYLYRILDELPAEEFKDSSNIVARLNLPNMAYARQAIVDIYAQALRGLLQLEPDQEKRLKYMDFVDIYSQLDDNEKRLFSEKYPQEKQTMTTWSERMRAEGREQGILHGMQLGEQKGVQQGELTVLLRLLTRRFGPLDAATHERLQNAGSAELEQWADNILDARTLDEVFDCP
ncbi:DUF4351 domain-containing protein [Azonexus sp.]|uniref:DUF4351 domain-containing protein n=1 Tax=Azonexus sp. TaxID=1872668 RepID=UPI0039E2EBE8